MAGRGDDDRVQLVELEKILDVGEDVRDREAIGKRPRLRPIVIAQRDQLRAAHLREDRDVGDLGDAADAHDADSDCGLHCGDDGGWLPKK